MNHMGIWESRWKGQMQGSSVGTFLVEQRVDMVPLIFEQDLWSCHVENSVKGSTA